MRTFARAHQVLQCRHILTMASSRIFVKGLPPTFSDADFRKHFSQKGREITDAKIFPNRRIGYVGYKTPEDAQKAVKYFNKTFIRMSKIGVELARPVDESRSVKPSAKAPTARKEAIDGDASSADSGLKRKRQSGDQAREGDPKLQEFLNVMKPASKKKAWKEEDQAQLLYSRTPVSENDMTVVDAQSDGEYETIPKKRKVEEKERPILLPKENAEGEAVIESASDEPGSAIPTDMTNAPQAGDKAQPPVSDADWARSRTSRLLGLLDDDEEDAVARKDVESSEETADIGIQPEMEAAPREKSAEIISSIPTPPSEQEDTKDDHSDPDVKAVRTSMRLFIRNLAYNTSREDLEAEFSPYGNLEEVSYHSVYSS